jgi:protein-S-isoprenylcysteine O-methyltransferase Ste14
MSKLELKIPPLALVLLAAAFMWLLSASVPSLTWRVPFGQAIAIVVAASGGIIATLGVISFRRADTTVNPTKPQATSSLVCTGIYRYTRNPMYLGFLLVLVAWALFLANILALVPAIAFVSYMNRFQIAPEERALESMFGTEFSAYKRSVRRWV